MSKKAPTQYKRDDLLIDLRESVMELYYTKKDGTSRTVRATLKKDILPPYVDKEAMDEEENKFHRENPAILTIWDMEANDWRSLYIDQITYAQHAPSYE